MPAPPHFHSIVKRSSNKLKLRGKKFSVDPTSRRTSRQNSGLLKSFNFCGGMQNCGFAIYRPDTGRQYGAYVALSPIE
jgi:hypothetical protein